MIKNCVDSRRTMETIDLLIIENHQQSTLLDKYIIIHHEEETILDRAVMPQLHLEKSIGFSHFYKHSFDNAPVIYIYGNNSKSVSSLALIHQFYPFGFVKVPWQNSQDYVLNEPPPLTFSAAQHIDPTILIPTLKEFELMAQIYERLERFKISVLILTVHQYTSIYGFNSLERFIKITYLNPNDRFRLWTLLSNGKVAGINFECFNFHFHYLDIFMREFDLQGCNSVHLKCVRYRRNIELHKKWLELINATSISTVEIEFDSTISEVFFSKFVPDVLTQTTQQDDLLLNKAWLSRKWNIPSVKELWFDEFQRRKENNIQKKMSQESVRSVDLQVKSGIFDTNRLECDLTTFKNPEKYPEWEQKIRNIIDKVLISTTAKNVSIHEDYKFEACVYCCDSVFLSLENHLKNFENGIRDRSFQILTNESVDESLLIDQMMENYEVESLLSEDLPSEVSQYNSESSGNIILQVDGQNDKKSPKRSRKIPFKPLNVIKTPPHRKRNSRPAQIWSPIVTTPTKRPEQLSVMLDTPTKCAVTPKSDLLSAPSSNYIFSTPVYQSLDTNQYIYNLKPPLYTNAFSFSPDSQFLNLKRKNLVNSWIYLRPVPLYTKTEILCEQPKKIDHPLNSADTKRFICKILCLEILAHTSSFHYNPETDRITCISYSLQNNWQKYCEKSDVLVDDDEYNLIYQLINLIKAFEPDIILGWDIHNLSFGYLVKRCNIYNIDILHAISRTDAKIEGSKWSEVQSTAFSTSGRLFLNAWRICRNNIDLRLYTLENTYQHQFKESFPIIPYKELNFDSHFKKEFAISYIKRKCESVLKILDSIDFICQTIEFSRLYGIPFESVLLRGSQYRVESALYRLCKNNRLLMASPTKDQVNQQMAAEFIPLVMEPSSHFYENPVSVVDFQSLYPSIMIAHNYCFSTLICKLDSQDVSDQLGCFPKVFDKQLLRVFYKYLTLGPNGAVYVNSKVKQGILTKLVSDLLDTRVMIKQSMKIYSDKHLLRLLNARQLALKLLANVIYGYTSASFSGRMPMVEVADSIVGMGRYTLQHTKDFIEDRYPVFVRYGDTDSLFIECIDYDRKSAIAFSQELIKEISHSLPNPMKLKFEKVYLKSFLLTKKRYCGYKVENFNDAPEFEAKGIETVRRDGCLLCSNLLKKALIFLFENPKKNLLMNYLTELFENIQDYPLLFFIIAKEVRVGTYKQLPPGAIVAQRQMENEPGFQSQYGDRQPYLVIYNESKLKDNVVSPHEFLNRKDWIINFDYYLEKQISPVFERIFQFVNIDIPSLIRSLNRKNINYRIISATRTKEYYHLNEICRSCMQETCLHSHNFSCENYTCKVFDRKLKINGEFY
eukprot:NODE_197_length_13258_cov_0.852344.p1 type:complete len:1346 gc:universal NODE_197_length_13258_cov_0.852344:8989-13026(+)